MESVITKNECCEINTVFVSKWSIIDPEGYKSGKYHDEYGKLKKYQDDENDPIYRSRPQWVDDRLKNNSLVIGQEKMTKEAIALLQ